MWYHAITEYSGKKRYWWNRSKEDIISDLLLPLIFKQVKMVKRRRQKALFNFSAVSYMTILKTKKQLKRPREDVVPPELKDTSFIKEHNATNEFINEIKLYSSSSGSRSLIEYSLSEPLNQIFVIMKLGDRLLDSAYVGVIKPLGEQFRYKVLRVDEIQDSGNINEQILEHIAKSKIILAELSGERPNCYYEAGFAHALGKEIIFCINERDRVHFDLAANRFIKWGTEAEFRQKLFERLKSYTEKGSQ